MGILQPYSVAFYGFCGTQWAWRTHESFRFVFLLKLGLESIALPQLFHWILSIYVMKTSFEYCSKAHLKKNFPESCTKLWFRGKDVPGFMIFQPQNSCAANCCWLYKVHCTLGCRQHFLFKCVRLSNLLGWCSRREWKQRGCHGWVHLPIL